MTKDKIKKLKEIKRLQNNAVCGIDPYDFYDVMIKPLIEKKKKLGKQVTENTL